jgi:hypothetical protein
MGKKVGQMLLIIPDKALLIEGIRLRGARLPLGTTSLLVAQLTERQAVL